VARDIDRRLRLLEHAAKLAGIGPIPTLSDWYGKDGTPCRRGWIGLRSIDFYDVGGIDNA